MKLEILQLANSFA